MFQQPWVSSAHFFLAWFLQQHKHDLENVESIVMAQPLGAKQRRFNRKKTVFMSTRDASRFPCMHRSNVLAKPLTPINLKILKAIFTETGKIGDEVLECKRVLWRCDEKVRRNAVKNLPCSLCLFYSKRVPIKKNKIAERCNQKIQVQT